uniref:uncharacterized protein n=1 Tax=Lonchura striata TaxID=40157 RepID=UPI0012935559|nr:uncharacterized protein LOC116183373 [Lonchura striata domestica]
MASGEEEARGAGSASSCPLPPPAAGNLRQERAHAAALTAAGERLLPAPSLGAWSRAGRAAWGTSRLKRALSTLSRALWRGSSQLPGAFPGLLAGFWAFSAVGARDGRAAAISFPPSAADGSGGTCGRRRPGPREWAFGGLRYMYLEYGPHDPDLGWFFSPKQALPEYEALFFISVVPPSASLRIHNGRIKGVQNIAIMFCSCLN